MVQGEGNKLLLLTDHPTPRFELKLKHAGGSEFVEHIEAVSFVGVKSVNAKGKRVSTHEVVVVKETSPEVVRKEENSTNVTEE